MSSESRKQLASLATALCAVGGLIIATLTFVVRAFIFHAGSCNDLFLTAAIALALCAAFPLLLNFGLRLPFRAMLDRVAVCLIFGAIITFMYAEVAGITVWAWHQNVPLLKEFAHKDFDQFDGAHTGVISWKQVDKVLGEQDHAKVLIQQLKQVMDQVDSAITDPNSKQTAKEALMQSEQQLRERLLPDEQIKRLQIVKGMMYPIGHPLTNDPHPYNHDYGCTKAELENADKKLEHDFHAWTVILRWLQII